MRNGRYIALPILFRKIASEKRIPHQKRSEDFECHRSFFDESALHPQPTAFGRAGHKRRFL